MVLALVGFRKVMDYFPNVFSQDDLFYLDNLMPSSNDKESDDSEDKSEPVSSYRPSVKSRQCIFFIIVKIDFTIYADLHPNPGSVMYFYPRTNLK